MFFYVYILKSLSDGEMYIGYTKNLAKRLEEHSDGISFSTKTRAPFKLIYYEAYLNMKDAQKREMFFKTGWGRQYIQKALKHYFSAKI